MKRILPVVLLAAALATPVAAQNQAANRPPNPDPANMKFLAEGAMAPDFTLPGASRYGVLSQPIKLSDYRGETVVLAFYFRARTPG